MLILHSTVLQSEGRTIDAPQEGESALNIIQELDALFPANPSESSFPDLESLAQKVYLRYMTTKAHQYALGDISRPADIYGEAGSPMDPTDDGGEKHGWDGDRQMANLTLRMRDCLWYYELCHAIGDGDIGRVMEIIKVMAMFMGLNLSLTKTFSFCDSHSGVLEHRTMVKS